MRPTWTFERNGERLILQRREGDGAACVLVIMGEASLREIPFSDASALAIFQADMEAFLIRTAWSLREYSPDRRGRDRRSFPRITADRRRWWTDGQPPTETIDLQLILDDARRSVCSESGQDEALPASKRGGE